MAERRPDTVTIRVKRRELKKCGRLFCLIGSGAELRTVSIRVKRRERKSARPIVLPDWQRGGTTHR